jgi:hypothetical protein
MHEFVVSVDGYFEELRAVDRFLRHEVKIVYP